MTGNDMMSIAIAMFWFVGIGMGFMFLYWLIIELPVYVRIKHNELYNKSYDKLYNKNKPNK